MSRCLDIISFDILDHAQTFHMFVSRNSAELTRREHDFRCSRKTEINRTHVGLRLSGNSRHNINFVSPTLKELESLQSKVNDTF